MLSKIQEVVRGRGIASAYHIIKDGVMGKYLTLGRMYSSDRLSYQEICNTQLNDYDKYSLVPTIDTMRDFWFWHNDYLLTNVFTVYCIGNVCIIIRRLVKGCEILEEESYVKPLGQYTQK